MMTWAQALRSPDIERQIADHIARAVWPNGPGYAPPTGPARVAARAVVATLASVTHIDSDIYAELLGERMLTAFRTASDHPHAAAIHALITTMPEDLWNTIVDFVADGIRGAT